MTNDELEKKSKDLETNFKQYQEIIKEAYDKMTELSSEYNKINDILKQRNVR